MVLHILILLLSIFLVVCISIDSFHNEAFYDVPRFMKVQFWICVIFLADFFIEFFLAPNKWHYISTHFLFFLVSIPYNSIITHYGWTFDPQLTYCLRYIPLIRGGYAMSIVVSWFTYNKATGLFISYLATLLFTIYFASLAFYLFEHGVNPLVVNYDDALWWAFMDATTVGSNITAVTTVGGSRNDDVPDLYSLRHEHAYQASSDGSQIWRREFHNSHDDAQGYSSGYGSRE